jgi:hypothetical protein
VTVDTTPAPYHVLVRKARLARNSI